MEETEVWHQAVCCQSTQTAITESHRLGLLNNTFIFSQFWRLESLRSVLQQRVVSGEASLQDLRIATFSMDPPRAERKVFSIVSPQRKTLILSDQGLPFWAHLDLITFSSLTSKQGHTGGI